MLNKRGLIINDRKYALEVLSQVGYYTFSGYLHQFKSNKSTYQQGLTFDKVYSLYKFDKKFKNTIMYAIEGVEKNLKSKISYYTAFAFGEIGYLENTNFDLENQDIYKRLVGNIKQYINNHEESPIIKHHIDKYNRILPIGVAVETFTLGNLGWFYEILPFAVQEKIASSFRTSTKHLQNWIRCVRTVRNMIAHNDRLYSINLNIVPKKSKLFIQTRTRKIYDVLPILKILLQNANGWDYTVVRIKDLINEYEKYINLKDIGFPMNWKKELT